MLVQAASSCDGRDTEALGPSRLHVRARRQMLTREHGGWFRSDWLNAGFVHLEVDGAVLQRMTPFEIDRFHGRSFVSLVAFDMRMFRPRGTGVFGAACMACAARHSLLNVRTYVRHRGEAGICFLTEWIPN